MTPATKKGAITPLVRSVGFGALIYHMLRIFHTLSGNNRTNNWIVNFPSTLRKVQQEIIGDNINFKDYVVCPKCHALYDFDSCIETRGSTCTSRQCLC